MTYVLLALGLAAMVLADLRWWRVAQREHYLSGSVSLFVRRWWYGIAHNLALWVLAIVALIASSLFVTPLFVTIAVVALGPVGLSPRGRSSKLAWTRRLKTLAAATVVFQLFFVAVGLLLHAGLFFTAIAALSAPTFVELALLATRNHERKIADAFVAQATKRLDQVAPLIIGITGSYGKTSTKVALAHILGATRSVFATPASFNNRNGLSRSINEQLSPGTEVFIAEMGTYGLGEIAELCAFCPPSIGVFTAIGPVHLERFGSEAAIIAAKSEIFENAEVAVINIDDDRLARVADTLEAEGKAVWRCGVKSEAARVRAILNGTVTVITVDDKVVAEVDDLAMNPGNVACAIAVALELEVPIDEIGKRLASLPPVPHRREINVNDKGVTVIDDTFNLNPASAASGLTALDASSDGRRIVVSPGMVELGRKQASENAAFATLAKSHATDFVIVGRTNRKALLAGAAGDALNVRCVNRLSQAVDWVRGNTEPGDAVLYANDLPDHHP